MKRSKKKAFASKEEREAANARCDAELAKLGLNPKDFQHNPNPNYPFLKGYIQRQKNKVRIHY